MNLENIDYLEYEMNGLIKELKKDHPYRYCLDEKIFYIKSVLNQMEKELENENR